MFSEIQRDYIRQLVLSQKEYKYYVARTNTNVSGQGGFDDVNFYVYLSNKPFNAVNAYSYTTDGDVLRYSVRSSNGSYNYHTERVIVEQGSTTVNFSNYEFCYTNASFSSYAVQPDCLISNSVNQSHFDGFSIALLIILVSVIFSRMIRKGGSYGFSKI